MDDECGDNGPALRPGIGLNSPLWFGCQMSMALAYVKTFFLRCLALLNSLCFLPRRLFDQRPCTILNKRLISPVSWYIGFGLFFSFFIKIPFFSN